MASFQIHEDQENFGQENHNKANVPLAEKKRLILGALENKPGRVFANKQNFGQSSKNISNNENCNKKQPACKLPPPVVPVAQFQAFKVYEDSAELYDEKLQRSIQNYQNKRIDEIFRNVYKGTEDDRLVTKQEVLEKAGIIDVLCPQAITLDSPMSVEKAAPKPVSDISLSTRNKDLFFTIEEYRESIYHYLLQKEKLHRPKHNYMRKQPDITNDMRTILVDWLVEVAQEYRLHTETLYLAVNFIDRFLSFMSVVRAKLQLVGTAAMFIAAKYEEITPPEVGDFVYITDDTYSKKQVLRMELLILKVLDLDLSVPTPYTFITAMSIPNNLSEKVTFLAQYLSELALLQAEPTLEIAPSVMAASAIAVARHTLGEEAWDKKLEETTTYTLAQLKQCIEFLTTLHQEAGSMTQQAIQEKYNSGKYLHVSSIPVREVPITFD